LLFNADGLKAFKTKIATEPWASVWKKYLDAAEKDLKDKVELPPRGGNWSHNYVCPEHGARLKRGKQIGTWEWEHICPVGPHTLKGNPDQATLDFDGNAIAATHGALAEQIIRHGMVYQVTGDERHAARAREILLAYADRYLSYPMHSNQGKKGKGARIASQSLTEASWIIRAAQGADLIWSTMTEEQRKAAAEKLFMPALKEIVLPAKLGIHNIQCRHNSAIGLVGFLLDDPELIRLAIDDPQRGYRQQLAKGVQDDGVWCEGAWGYHFFTIAGLWPLAEAAHNCGIDLYSPEFKKLFDGPLALATPEMTLPAFNDSGEVDVAKEADLYELAYARFRNPLYATILNRSRRESEAALFWGVTELPKADAISAGSRNAEASGYAMLERGQGTQATWLCLKYGPHGGGHGHNDKLSFVLYARGMTVAPDPGTKAYGSPLHKDWDKTSFAHSTLVVDQESQKQATGKCLAFGKENGADFVLADAGPIYDGVRFTRAAVLLNENLILFVDQVRCDKEHTLDIVYHQKGTWEKEDRGESWKAPSVPGYKYLQDASAKICPEGIALALHVDAKWNSSLAVAGNEPVQTITGTSFGKDTTDRVPLVVFRRKARETAFVWAIALDSAAPKLRVLSVQDDGKKALPAAQAVAVQVGEGASARTVLVNPDGRNVSVNPPGGTAWSSEAKVAVRP
jgi:hypothetical protein